jgi:hypothetical protein
MSTACSEQFVRHCTYSRWYLRTRTHYILFGIGLYKEYVCGLGTCLPCRYCVRTRAHYLYKYCLGLDYIMNVFVVLEIVTLRSINN